MRFISMIDEPARILDTELNRRRFAITWWRYRNGW